MKTLEIEKNVQLMNETKSLIEESIYFYNQDHNIDKVLKFRNFT